MRIEGWAVLYAESEYSFAESIFLYSTYPAAVVALERAQKDKKIRKTLRFEVPVYISIERTEGREQEVREAEAVSIGLLQSVEGVLDNKEPL